MFKRCGAPRRKSKWKKVLVARNRYTIIASHTHGSGRVEPHQNPGATQAVDLYPLKIKIHGHKCNHANQNREASGEPNFETTAQSGGRQVHFPVTDMRNLRAAAPDPSPDSDPRTRGKRLRHPEFHHSMRAPGWNSTKRRNQTAPRGTPCSEGTPKPSATSTSSFCSRECTALARPPTASRSPW